MTENDNASVLEAIDACLLLTDEKHRITFANRMACELLESSKEQLLTQDVVNVLSGVAPDGIKFQKAYSLYTTAYEKKVMQSGYRILLRSRKDKACSVQFTCMPLLQKSELKGMVITFRDISENLRVEEKLKDAIQEQLKNEQQLREAQEQLVQAEKMQSIGRLAAGVAHEVKNPIAIILQGTEYLQSSLKNIDDDTKMILDDLIDAVLRADKVIKSLLDYATPKDAEMESSDINVILDESLHLIKHLTSKNKIEIQKHYSKDLESVVLDRSRMQQVFINVFSNAVHAMPSGGEIIIKTRPVDSQSSRYKAIIEIEDTGVGISKEILRKVFDPFLTTRQGRGGTGLGLSVVRGIVEMHNGSISIDNRDEGGARVTIKL